MNGVVIIFVAFLAINSGPSSALSGISDSPSKKNYIPEELGACPMNTSISVKVFRNLKGEWLTSFVDGNKLLNFTRSMGLTLERNVLECGDSRYITISGFLQDTEADNSSEATVGNYRNNTDGEAYDSCKGINELTTIAEDNANQTMKALQIMEKRMNSFEETQNRGNVRMINELTTIAEDNANQTMKALQIMEQRMNSFKETQNNINETLISFEKTQNNINETLISFDKTQNNITDTLISLEKTQTSFQRTLTNMEQVLNEVRGLLNSTKNLDTEVKDNAKSKPSPPITKAKAHTFDNIIKGKKVKLSSDLRSATRVRPTEDYGVFGGVVSNSLLEEDELFQIRIDETTDGWSDGGIAIGVIEEKKEEIRDTGYIHDGDIKGTWGIYSDYVSQSGKCDLYKDGRTMTKNGYSLPTDDLPVGTLLGVSRRSNGDLHFYLNGVDKGPAFRNVPKDVYAFVDVDYYVTKISIINKP